MKGKPFHNSQVEASLQRLEVEGWRVIRHNEKLPTYLAVKEGLVFGVVVVIQTRRKNGKGWHSKKPLATISRRYGHLDGMLSIRCRTPGDNIAQRRKEGLAKLKTDGFRIIAKGRKCPDALLVKDGQVWAFELLTASLSSSLMSYSVRAKKAQYGMFDGCLVEVQRP